MTEKQPSMRQLNSVEIDLLIKLHNGDGSEGIVNLESFLAAKEALFDTVEKCMRGEYESTEEIHAHIDALIDQMSESFTTAFMDEEDFGDRIDSVSSAFCDSVASLKDFVDKFSTSVSLIYADQDAMRESLYNGLEEYDFDGQCIEVEEFFKTLHLGVIHDMLKDAKESALEVYLKKRQHQKQQAVAVSREIAKASLNAFATAAAIILLGKKA